MFKENVCGGEHNILDFDPELKSLLSELGEDLTSLRSNSIPDSCSYDFDPIIFTNCII